MMTYEEWEESFLPKKDANGEIIHFDWTVAEDLAELNKVDSTYIWTLVTGDDGGTLFITPGRRFVNRLEYFICEKPHQGSNTEDVTYE